MENLTRKNKRRTALESGVRLDSSATHFKNSKLSENLESTLDSLFRKKNLARISQRNLVSKTRKDFEYLQAVKQVVKLEHQKHKYGPSTSASTKRQLDTSKPETALQFSTKPDLDSKKAFSKGSLKQTIDIRESSSFDSDSSSSVLLSDLSDSDDENYQTLSAGHGQKIMNKVFSRTDRNSKSRNPPSDYEKKGVTRFHFQPLSASRQGTIIRHTGHAIPTKQQLMSQNFVYDPGDVYLVSRAKKHQPMFPYKKERPKTVLGFFSSNTGSEKECKNVQPRQCQSASLSRRKLRDMNNIDALIESAETPIFMDCTQLRLENNKQHFKTLQTRVNSFLISVDDFTKRTSHKKDMALLFLEDAF